MKTFVYISAYIQNMKAQKVCHPKGEEGKERRERITSIIQKISETRSCTHALKLVQLLYAFEDHICRHSCLGEKQMINIFF